MKLGGEYVRVSQEARGSGDRDSTTPCLDDDDIPVDNTHFVCSITSSQHAQHICVQFDARCYDAR